MQPTVLRLVFPVFLLAGPIRAADFTWTGAVSSDWSNPANWSPAGVPGPGDRVTYPSGKPTLSLNGDRTVAGFAQAGGILAGPGQLTVTGSATWSGGTLRDGCVLFIPTNAFWTITGSAAYSLLDATVRIGGVARWESTVNIGGGLGALLEILPGGVFEIRNNEGFYHTYSGAAPTFRNAGTVRKLESTGVSNIGVPFHNEGEVVVFSGTLRLTRGGSSPGRYLADAPGVFDFGGGTHDLSSTAIWQGNGTFRVTSGTVNLAGACELTGNAIISGGTLNYTGTAGRIARLELVSGTLTGGGRLEFGDTLNWSGGTLSGPGEVVIAAGGRLVLSGTGGRTLRGGRVVRVAGEAVWEGAGNLSSGEGARVVIEAGGQWVLGTDADFLFNWGGERTVVQNAGRVRKSGGTGTSVFSGVAFQNAGTLAVDMGTCSFTGPFSQEAGLFQVGLKDPTDLGQIRIQGTAPLNGTFAAVLREGFVPTMGATFPVVLYGSRSGGFTNWLLPTLPAGLAWRASYLADRLQLEVTSAPVPTAQITGAVRSTSGNPIPGASVFAFRLAADGVVSLGAVTDATGTFRLSVANGTWQVGVLGLPALGFREVANQTVNISGADREVHFVCAPLAGQNFLITVRAQPETGGTVAGGGTYPEGSEVTVTAVPSRSPVPYVFLRWTEGGVEVSREPAYTFMLTRNRDLVGHFALETFTVTAANDPPAGGRVSGTGTFSYGATCTLRATPNFGYRFDRWTEGGALISTNVELSLVVQTNRALIAHYGEAHLWHVVTTATQPSDLAPVTGGGTYTNGQTATFSAPTSLTDALNRYTFSHYLWNGVWYTSANPVTKTFATTDPTNVTVTAVYQVQSLQPRVAAVEASPASPVPATTNFTLRVRFDRSMRSAPEPVIVLTNRGTGTAYLVPGGGGWSSSYASNDLYRTPPLVITPVFDGTNEVWIAGARDVFNYELPLTNALQLVVDATPPRISELRAVAGPNLAVITWVTDEPATSQVEYGELGVPPQPSPLSTTRVTAHRVELTGLAPDRQYHFRARSRDRAGNETVSAEAILTTGPAPDLSIARLTVEPPGDLTSGLPVLVRWSLTNSGPGAVTNSWYDRVVVSNTTQGAVIADTLVYHNSAVLGPLPGGAARERELALVLPDGPPGAGPLEFIVSADALGTVFEWNAAGTAETNNLTTLSRLSTLAAYPDLVVTDLAVSPAAPSSGQTLTLTWRTRNTGTAPVIVSFVERLMVRNLDTGETFFADLVRYDVGTGGPIAPGGTRARQFTMRLPDGPRGVGRLQIELLTDSQDQVFEYNAAGTGQVNNAAALEVTATLAAYPDLAVTTVIGPTEALPGQEIPVVWSITNRGNAPAAGTWSDQVFLSGDSLPGNDLLLGSFIFSGNLPAGQTLTRTQSVSLPIFGAGPHWLLVRADAGQVLYELDKTNNLGVATQPLNLKSSLALLVSPDRISEGAGENAATGRVRRNTDPASPLAVSLTSSDTNKIRVPAQVVIPAGRSEATFPIATVDNEWADGPVLVTVTAAAAGFEMATATLSVQDDDLPQLLLRVSRSRVAEGDGPNAALAYLTRNGVTNVPLSVALVSDRTNNLAVPATVRFEAGERHRVFPLAAVDNAILEGTVTVRLQATAPGYPPTSARLEVTDNDVPVLTLVPSETLLAEGGPSPAARVTVTRSPVTDHLLILHLGTGGPSDLIYPSQIVIGAREASATFGISVRDDDRVNGAREVLLRAAPRADNGTVLDEYAAEVRFEVLDNDGPSLSLHLTGDVVREGDRLMATVARNTDPATPLTVSLASSDPGEAQVPASVIIPAGRLSTTFTVSGVRDGISDGTRPVLLTASAPGFNPAMASLSVTDLDVPDLRVVEIRAPTSALGGSVVQVTWVVTNAGLAAATGSWSDRVDLSLDAYAGGDTSVGGATFNGSLAAGGTYARTALVTLPETPRDHWLVVGTDADNALAEGAEHNNTAVSAVPIRVQPAWRALAETEVDLAPCGTPVPIRGRAWYVADQSPAAGRPVEVRIRTGAVRRVLRVVADARGEFACTFEPLPTEAGRYTLGAEHPGVSEDPVQDQFALVGFAVTPERLALRLAPLTPVSGRLELRNRGQVPLSGLRAVLSNAPPDLDVQLAFPDALPGSGTAVLTYTLSTSVTNRARFEPVLHLTTAEGARTAVPLEITVVPLRPELVADPPFLARGMVRGTRTLLSFDVANVGGAPSGGLEVRLPEAAWLGLASEARIPSLAPGEKTTVTLAVNPPADLPLTRYDGQVGLFGDRVWVIVPFQLRAVSEAVGDLVVTVSDEYTYYVAGAPRVTNAAVRLRDPLTLDLVAESTTGADGRARFTNLREGPYTLEAAAERHATHRGNFLLQPGIENAVEVFLARQVVTYRWTVVPLEIEDTYRIVLEPVFETEVPVPVVVMENPHKVELVVPGQTTQFDITLVNHGLIAAQNVRLILPRDPDYEITPLVWEVPVLPARSRITIPTSLRLREGTAADLANARYLDPASAVALAGAPLPADGPPPMCKLKLHGCLPGLPLGYTYEYECNGPKKNGGSGDLRPVCVDQDKFDCTKDLLSCLLGREPCDPCDLALALIACAGADMSPCLKAALLAACNILTKGGGGLIGSLPGFLECLCDLLSGLGSPDPSDPGPGGGGGLLLPGLALTSKNVDIRGPGWGMPDCTNHHGGVQGVALAGQLPVRHAPPGAGVCARVRLRIEQEAVLTRTAFLGTLELDNGGPHPLEGIRVTLEFRDLEGNPAGERFVIRGPEVSGLSDVNGSGRLAPFQVGTARYTFIPTRDAAPTAPAVYHIGGTLRYLEAGQEVLVPLYSAGITVFPEPRLHLMYFQQRDVFSDDPFTDEIEPAEPFALGLIARNLGAGPARNFRITSAQPRIIENEKGLLVDFKIIGTQVGDQPVAPTLTAQLGHIPPGGAQTAVWWMTSTLQGKFVEYHATFEHVDSLGVTNLSLIESVEVHELIRAVRTDRPGDDALPDFLVNEEPDPESLPDTLYLSDGTRAVVNPAANVRADHAPTPDRPVVRLTAAMPSGWSYLRAPDPGPGYRLVRVVRSDGRELRVGVNAWTTDRTFPSAQAGPRREHHLHLLDHDSPGEYTLHYRVNDTEPPRILAITGLAPGAQPEPVSQLDVLFSEPIDPATFNYEDLVLSHDGGPNRITPGISVQHITGSTYRVGNLAGLTDLGGNYELTVRGEGIRDFGGNPAANSLSVRWAYARGGPVAIRVGPVLPDLRNNPVGAVDVEFSHPINPFTFDASDLMLTRDNGPNLISPAVMVAALSPTTFRVGGLDMLTRDEGHYRLTVRGFGVRDTEGQSGAGLLSTEWTVLTTGPRLVALETVATNPRNIVVLSLDVTFAAPIDPASFDHRDLTLTRDGGPNLITPEVRIERLSDTVYRIREFNWVVGQEGTYTLTVNAANIFDRAGNPGSGALSTSWIMDTTPPAAPRQLAVTPDLGISASDALTSTNVLTLTGTVTETNLTVRVRDESAGADLGVAVVIGTNFHRVLRFTAPGLHALQVRAVDAAGNVSPPATLPVFLDLVPPTAAFEPVAPDPRSTPVSAVVLRFSEPIVTATLGPEDFTLSRDGSSNLVTASLTVTHAFGESFVIGGLAALTSVPGEYRLRLKPGSVEDRAGNANLEAAEVAWTLRAPNSPPRLARPANFHIGPEMWLVFTNTATDADVPPNRLTFRLEPGAPAGATVDPETGVFRWRPTRTQAPGVYPLTLTVTDDGTPPLSDSATFTVTVTDYLELRWGRVAVLAGGTVAVPLHLFSSGSLTNLQFELRLSSERLTDLVLEPQRPQIATGSVQQLVPTRYAVNLRTRAGQSLKGEHLAALLHVTARTGALSEFVTLESDQVAFQIVESVLPGVAFVIPGRVAVLAEQPLLEATVSADGSYLLFLFGPRGLACQLQWASRLGPDANWTDWQRVVLSALEQPVPLQALPFSPVFFRAVVIP